MDQKRLLYQKEDEVASVAEEISTTIFQNPELGNEEYFSSEYLCRKAEEEGFDVTPQYLNIPTSFCAAYGEKGPTIAFLAEYDALPGYDGKNGHACGHNWIAASTYAAAASLKRYLEETGTNGRVIWLGTPAEETTSEKITLINRGAFSEIDAVFQMHLGLETRVDSTALAMTILWFEFSGLASHASGSPEKGVNALDAVNLTYAGISALRQQLKSDVRIHSVIREGGMAPNIIPDHTVMEVYVRSADKDYLEEAIQKVCNCARGACLMTGCTLKITRDKYTTFNINNQKDMTEAVSGYLKEFGQPPVSHDNPYASAGSTDIGNVSYVVPTCYTYMGTGEYSDAKTHDAAFLTVADSDFAHRQLHIAAKCMAAAALDILTDPHLQTKVREAKELLTEAEKKTVPVNKTESKTESFYDKEGNKINHKCS